MPTLVTPNEACDILHVSRGMISYWLRKGLLTRYPKPRQLNGPRGEYYMQRLGPECGRNTVIDLDVARDLVTSNAIKKLKQGNPAANLLTTREIAKLTNRTVSTIDSYVRRFGLKKYYIHEHTTHYLIDGEELADRMEEAGLPLT